ncbi:unnamed protein product [Choristocarpus tenellus]
MTRSKASESIGRALQDQYEKLQPRQYKQSLDPTVDEVRKLCLSVRKSAKNDRALIHYNGHGVPRPSEQGEVWVFNRTYTQYIPLSVYDIKLWAGTPSIFVLDCSAAGHLMPHLTAVEPTEEDEEEGGATEAGAEGIVGAGAGQQHLSHTMHNGSPVTPPNGGVGGQNGYTSEALAAAATAAAQAQAAAAAAAAEAAARASKDCIVLACCGANEKLPMNPELPADLFTSCLTTPIPIALRWFIWKNKLSMEYVDPDWVDEIPGKLGERKTPLGELNWIFTAIMDAIAWNTLPSTLFQKLFRQDLLVASLFRNFLLADRMLRSLNCTPMSYPRLPPTCQHPLWQSWDLAAETGLSRLHAMRKSIPHKSLGPLGQGGQGLHPAPDGFFREQLMAFGVWLELSTEATRSLEGGVCPRPPEQLPVVLQVLLSQAHRLRALVLLRRFLDLGPWAVNLSLSVGIFPYVLKLLQVSAPAVELRQVLICIWARILAFDPSCQARKSHT